MITEVERYPARKAVLFVRVQEANKVWLAAEAKRKGYPDVATFMDIFITALREKGTPDGKERQTSKKS